MEKNITCPVCFTDTHCFEEVQETFSSYLCFKCGFMSDSRLEIGSAKLTESLKQSPQLVRNSKFEDKERNIVWYPSVVNMGPKGIIYPEGRPDSYVWKYAKVVDIPDSEQKKYPVAGKEGEYYKTRLDTDGASSYGRYEFLDACKEMGIAVDK